MKMTLATLLKICDPAIAIVLTGVTTGGMKSGYDFKKMQWSTEWYYTPSRIIAAGRLKSTEIYAKHRNSQVDLHILYGVKALKSMEGVETHNDIILEVKVPIKTRSYSADKKIYDSTRKKKEGESSTTSE